MGVSRWTMTRYMAAHRKTIQPWLDEIQEAMLDLAEAKLRVHRSIVVHMDRHDGTRELRRFDANDAALDAIYRENCLWAKNCNLALDPEMPTELRNRQRYAVGVSLGGVGSSRISVRASRASFRGSGPG
jgi:hypothetical protein